jgi:hypothetical protein
LTRASAQLAFPALANWTVPTVFQSIITSTGVTGSFALWLSSDPTDTSSQLTLGGYDATCVHAARAVVVCGALAEARR